MRNSSNFPIALSASLIIHLSAILLLSALGVIPKQAAFNEMEITYYPVKSTSVLLEKKSPRETFPKNLDDVKDDQPIILSPESKIPEKSISAPGAGSRELFGRIKDYLQKPPIPKTEFIAKNTIKLSPASESSDKISRSPAYLAYGAYARERIQRSLHRRLSLVRERGVVCLEFSILADGSLSGIRIISERSSASETLKGIAVEGLKGAAPFPRPPGELSGQPVTYTVFIHFVIQENK
ncbi:TonB family protein [bacterium]|nr:MAG: TonB family protein [bacterium]